jgi:hypothetical protein
MLLTPCKCLISQTGGAIGHRPMWHVDLKSNGQYRSP